MPTVCSRIAAWLLGLFLTLCATAPVGADPSAEASDDGPPNWTVPEIGFRIPSTSFRIPFPSFGFTFTRVPVAKRIEELTEWAKTHPEHPDLAEAYVRLAELHLKSSKSYAKAKKKAGKSNDFFPHKQAIALAQWVLTELPYDKKWTEKARKVYHKALGADGYMAANLHHITGNLKDQIEMDVVELQHSVGGNPTVTLRIPKPIFRRGDIRNMIFADTVKLGGFPATKNESNSLGVAMVLNVIDTIAPADESKNLRYPAVRTLPITHFRA